jgi:hypothetical protein
MQRRGDSNPSWAPDPSLKGTLKIYIKNYKIDAIAHLLLRKMKAKGFEPWPHRLFPLWKILVSLKT